MSVFEGDLTSIGICLTLERSDGTGLALTSHDRPIDIGATTFEARVGLVPNSVQQGDADSPATEFSSPLNVGLLREADLVRGRWDGARVTMVAASWENPQANVEVASGRLDEIELVDGKFTADVAGTSARLKQPVCPVTSPECRASFGDKRCRIDLAQLRMRATVVQAQGPWLELDTEVGDAFLMGEIRFLDGSLCGLIQTVVDTGERRIRLREEWTDGPAVGVRVLLTQGCDKRAETCRSRFDNIANFRGEPHVPGTDFLMRYPGT